MSDSILQVDKIIDKAATSNKELAQYSSGNWGWGAGVPSGTILQVQYVQKTDTFSTQSGSLVAIPGFNVDITPASSSNKILITCHVVLSSNFFITHCGLFRDTNTEIGLADDDTSRPRSFLMSAIDDGNEDDGEVEHLSNSFLDSPNTTSQVNYGLKMARRYDNANTPTSYFNRSVPDRSQGSPVTYDSRYISTMYVMEIAQ
tara:strand:+ start:1935 stop:2540 length:606 start_codon:yes stop_codon:yes gene_type:complete